MISPATDEQELAPAGESERHLRSSGEFWLILACLTTLYATAVMLDSRRFVWFDELFTFDIARSTSLHQLWERTLHFDFTPPPVFLLSRFSMKVLGPNPFALRLPSMVEFYLGSVALFLYLRRRVGNAVSALGILIVWSSPIFYYATEARPYALVFMGFALLLLSWNSAVQGETRRLAIFGVACSTTVLLSAHVFAPLSWFPFLVAEAVRFWRRRKPDHPLWAALLLPAVVMVMYIPLIQHYSGIIIQPAVRASWHQIVSFFYSPFGSIARAMLLAILALLLLPAAKRRHPATRPSLEEAVIFVLLLLNPILLNVVLMRRHGGFFDRYCITTTAVIYLTIAIPLAFRLRPGRTALSAASLVMVSMMAHTVLRNREISRINQTPWASFRPDLPVVAARGRIFYEMNHHEGQQLLSRLYFLKDRDASIRYEGTNYFHDFEAPDDMKAAGFPITAHIEPYSQFIHQHHKFLVYGNVDEWVLRKLHDDGATETLITDYSTPTPYVAVPYAVNCDLYLITMRQP